MPRQTKLRKLLARRAITIEDAAARIRAHSRSRRKPVRLTASWLGKIASGTVPGVKAGNAIVCWVRDWMCEDLTLADLGIEVK